MIAAYVRVSSPSQSQAMQVDAIESAARARGHTVARWFREKESAKRIDRPELGALRTAIRLGEVRTLYVFRLDRLSRSGIRDTLTVVEEFRRNGCRLVSISDGFELDGPAADVVIAVLAWAAQMERAAIGERIAAARARKEAKGEAWGRPRRLAPSDVQKIRNRSAAGFSIRQIASALKIPRTTVASALSGKGPYAQTVMGPKISEKNDTTRGLRLVSD